MSRIILARWPTGQERVVVGWDHPCGGAFWQEFTEEPADGNYPDDFEEMLREGGFFKGIPLAEFRESMPEDLRPLITDDVMALLARHERDPNSGYNQAATDLSAEGQAWKAEQEATMEERLHHAPDFDPE
jgi:hypothetical protein